MVVRMRHNRGQTGSRRSHHRLEAPRLSKDQDGVVHLRHRMTPSTGKYRGRVIIDLAAKKSAKLARQKANTDSK